MLQYAKYGKFFLHDDIFLILRVMGTHACLMQYARKNLTSCQQVVFATSLYHVYQQIVAVLLFCSKFVSHKLLTSC